ncbi:2-dehydro-3-deoxygalactonokinase [Ancylobacter sp. A5.8]|uniref:2-dehydro-3-deoxygalactonokinase n=1 Tax=Ancylobacter gelatini TaxID=2919920 RepID=UPI001F4E9431|nr:2-dehydro-3-deoxygalactonokinase [Ancylobacter gelatini]MCJ8145211.1 2-dehydro-3-deoxygalactonokinase [Ancylobacter gelatini]
MAPQFDRLSHIAVDWGTSSFRLWALDAQGNVLAERRSAQGLAAASSEGFETTLEAHLAALAVPDGVPVMMCGMVGSRSGWVEAAYVDTPATLDGLVAQAVQVPSTRRRIRILPGLAQRDPARPDVMRGEETQLLALASAGVTGPACLPGTHSKWVRMQRGEVEHFATFMTGELFQLLRAQSVVAPAVAGAVESDPAGTAFALGVGEGLSAPETVSHALFRLRAAWLLTGAEPADTLSRLSGLLIGAELAGAARLFGTLDGVALVASGPLARAYRAALSIAGVGNVAFFDAENCVRAGLHAAAITTFRLERNAP